ncbi:polyphosphate kinase 2 family protein [Slackia heliotrinireducens]|jgi:PPK2 family polyphosphate:nucleotide phosphotransferase|uniref:polyphosphate kinase 2 family protein n=1 Tax=Slackia heliotrinireducens TaxID=84110 RepID=UPI003315DDBD
MELKDCIVDGSKHFHIADAPTSAKIPKSERAHYEELTDANRQRMIELQDRLYAQGCEGVLVLFQAMDAAGKDSTIKHVMSGLNPQGVEVYSFKTPSKEELAHDYLWRAYRHLPKRGNIGVFNRSYYEDVLVVRTHGLWHDYNMPKRCLDMSEKDFFAARYKHIAGFEKHLYENGYRLVKVFLNVGMDEQKKRFIARIDEPAKNWKFSPADLDERPLWPKYMEAFEDAINGTSTKHCPWYVIPADQKWYARYLVSEALLATLEDINPQYPTVSEEDLETMAVCKVRLETE